MKRRRTKRSNRAKRRTITAQRAVDLMSKAFSKALVDVNTNRTFKHKQLGWVRANSLFNILLGEPHFIKVKKPN